ncbi:tRNA (N(6)-L-threonylcarbamoyladenosine(37)-C(2))-methylthiotransferase MtaB [Pseudonocardia sp. TMWB2A]
MTLGCRLNIAESEAIRLQLAQAGHDEPLIVVNSCAVTQEAVRSTRRAIRRAKRDNPDARLVVTGCAAQIDPASFGGMAEVDLVLGNREKADPSQYLSPLRVAPAPKIHVTDIMAVTDTAPQLAAAFADHARAFVEVQNGCDHRCTFCIIPYGRGNSRSVPAGVVVDQVQQLVDEGHKEIVLTGVDVTSYGHDLPGQPTLGHLIERLLVHVRGLERLRLSSLDSIEIDERMFTLVTGERRVMPHLHLSLQAGDNMILKRMKRRHSREQAIAVVERLLTARSDIAIGADIIAGFPTESEAMFANSLKLITDCSIVYGHIFPYSPREGTPAARMPQLAVPLIKERAGRLRDACAANKAAFLESLVGTEQNLLVERDGLTGHAENFAGIRLENPLPPGHIAPVTIKRVEKGFLIA